MTNREAFDIPVILTKRYNEDKSYREGYQACSQHYEARIKDLAMICAIAYQCVGTLLEDAGRFEDNDGDRLLTMLSDMKLDESMLPFKSKAETK